MEQRAVGIKTYEYKLLVGLTACQASWNNIFTYLLVDVVQSYDHVLQLLSRRFLECLALLRVLEQVLLVVASNTIACGDISYVPLT